MPDPTSKPTNTRRTADLHRSVIELPINADPPRVWRAITDEMDKWWLPHFRMAPGSKRVVLEQRVGGRWMEAAGPEGTPEDSAGILWGTVIMIDPGKSITLTGHVAPPWGACLFMIVLDVKPGPKPGTTTFTATHIELGHIEDRPGMTMQEGWTELFREGLKKFCEQHG